MFRILSDMKDSDLQARIDSLIADKPDDDAASYHSRYQAALSIMVALHGENSSQVKSFLRQGEQAHERFVPGQIHYGIAYVAEGAIKNLKAEIDAGFSGTLRQSVTGEVITDFLGLSRLILAQDQTAESKNVAAVLAAAAFEDTLRRLAESKGIPHLEKLADVIRH